MNMDGPKQPARHAAGRARTSLLAWLLLLIAGVAYLKWQGAVISDILGHTPGAPPVSQSVDAH